MRRFLHCSFAILLFFSALLLGAPIPVHAQEDEIIEKTYCTLGIAYASLDELKTNLETNAKRLAVNEFFGELISASTAVNDSVVTSDQIRASSLGLIRISGSTEFFNGDNFGDTCATIAAYVTAADRAQFEPVAITKRLCLSNDGLSVNSLTVLVRGEAVIQALYDFDSRLESADRSTLPTLVRRITYSDAGFLADTATYCATMTGYVVPVEALAFGAEDEAGEAFPTGALEEIGSNATASEAEGGAGDIITLADRYVEECKSDLQYGQIVRCSLQSEKEEHTYTFEVNADERFAVVMVRDSGDLSPSFKVYDKNGDEVWVGNSHCSSTDARQASRTCTAKLSGVYSVVARTNQAGTAGTYRLMLQRYTSPGFATHLEDEEIVDGTLVERAQNDYYTFAVERDEQFVVTMTRTSGDLAPAFRVWDRNGEDAYVGNSLCSASHSKQAVSRVCTAKLSGEYTIVAYAGEADTTGTYELTIQKQN